MIIQLPQLAAHLPGRDSQVADSCGVVNLNVPFSASVVDSKLGGSEHC
jgi:hypothetical protein